MYKTRRIQDVVCLFMKISLAQFALMTMFASVVTAAEIRGQDVLEKPITLSVSANELSEVLRQIEDQASVSFTYRTKTIKGFEKVTLDVKNVSLGTLLEEILGKDVTIRVRDNEILLKPRMASDVDKEFVEVVVAVTVTGTIVDGGGGPLPGVNVVEKGTTNGTTTDGNGRFTLNVEGEKSVLVFSFIGYETQEVVVGSRTSISIVLQETATALEEVVVVGYGTQKKVNLTGAVGTVSSEMLENRSIANVGEGLQGVIPNLNITVRNGDPASPPSFNVRGFTSINGGEPLVLVDNVPMDINRINPNDIESISVLKDASAAAIYGGRAAFGVILVETKSAKKGRTRINLNTQVSMAKPILNMDVMKDPYQYAQVWNQASMRTQGTPMYDDEFVQNTKAWSDNPTLENAWKVQDGVLQFYGFNNYQDQLITDFAPAQQHNLSISGGSENTDYYVSAGYFSKDGYLRDNNSRFKRYNILMKADFKVNNWLSLHEQVVFNSQSNDSPTEYSWDVHVNSLARVGTVMPIQFPDLPFYITPGDREEYLPYIGKYFGGQNFFPYLMEGGRETFTNNDLWLTTGATLTPFKNFKVVSNFSYQIYNRIYQNVRSKVDIVSRDLLAANRISHDFSSPDFISNTSINNKAYVFNVYGAYDYDFESGHHLTATVGFNQEWYHYQSLAGTAYSLITPSVPNIHATTGTQQVDGGAAHTALRGAFYRLNYNFKERYLFEASGRYDGTSRFPKDGRFGFFPSFSAGWRISNENFMASTGSWLDNLKIRASYGELGNQLLGSNYYPYISTMNSGIPSAYPLILEGSSPELNILWPNLVSPHLTWERVISRNIGLDVTLLNAKLDVSFDAYTRDTKDMLRSRDYPDILGATPPQENAADLRTKGWELSLTWRDKIKNDWDYDVTVGLSDWTSEITKYENPGGNISDYYVGKAIGEIWGLETIGLFQTPDEIADAPSQANIGANWKPGDVRYADLNNDGVINRGSGTLSEPGDVRVIGNTTPRYQFGVNLGLRYKNWGLSTFFQGVGKRDMWPSTNSWTWFYPFKSHYMEEWAIEESWSEDNRDAYFPAPSLAYDSRESKNYQVQSRFLQKAAYVRLKNVTVSYTLPQSLLQRIGVADIQVYFTGMNLWEWSRIRRPLDPESIPEVTAGTVGAIEFPMQRLYTLGARLSF